MAAAKRELGHLLLVRRRQRSAVRHLRRRVGAGHSGIGVRDVRRMDAETINRMNSGVGETMAVLCGWRVEQGLGVDRRGMNEFGCRMHVRSGLEQVMVERGVMAGG